MMNRPNILNIMNQIYNNMMMGQKNIMNSTMMNKPVLRQMNINMMNNSM